MWTYHWNAAGMLAKVTRPDGLAVEFAYDALGRRTRKTFRGRTTRWVWDGDNPLHEWVEGKLQEAPASSPRNASVAEAKSARREAELAGNPAAGPPIEESGTSASPITWLFEPESFSPMAKVVGGKRYSIVTDHLGTPLAMFDTDGKEIWSARLDIYGQLTNLNGGKEACPFRFPGQYEDEEVGLSYNRYRYYDAVSGLFISQDPIGLEGGFELYKYVSDPIRTYDPFGLTRKPWDLTRERSSATKVIGKRTYYKHDSTGLWWSRDTAGHGDSAFKVFKEGPGESLDWYRDADEFGDFIDPEKKHKGPKGKKMCG
jgi:RHS repeat-associated protein